MMYYFQETITPPDEITTLAFIHHGPIANWPQAVLAFFNKLRPSKDGVPILDLKQILMDETGHEVTAKAIRTLLWRRGLPYKDGIAYVE